MTYRAAVVGCGRIGTTLADDPLLAGDVMTHAEAYSVCRATELVAVADSDEAAARRCAERWGISRSFASAAQLLAATRPDIVSVATPTSSHVSVLNEILDAPDTPRAIICEKPLAHSLDEAEGVVARARERGIVLLVVHMRRYARNMQNLKGFLAASGIGELRGVAGWLTKGTLHNGTHWFDLLRYLIGDVGSVSALDILKEPGDDPTLDVSLFLTNGMLATMRAADASRFTICEMDILGTSGRVRIVDSSYAVELTRAGDSTRYSGYVELLSDSMDFGDRKDVMLHAVEDVVRCLDTGEQPISSGEDGVEALRIALAAHESAATGKTVNLGGPLRTTSGAAA